MQTKDFNFVFLKGSTIIAIECNRDEVKLTTSEGHKFLMHHDQDCCESVHVESIVGDIVHLLHGEITEAKEDILRDGNPPGASEPEYRDDSWTWTTFTLTTKQGTVAIRWYGSSNGYYSESVSFVETF